MAFTLPQLVDEWAERTPDADAIGFLGERLTYAELSRRSDALARALIDAGVRRTDRVGIHMDKNLHTAVAMYGIMKAGAAYVPLDPSAPPQRTAGVIGDCGIRHLITDDAMAAGLRAMADALPDAMCLIGVTPDRGLPGRAIPWDAVATLDGSTAALPAVIENDLAYIIYTSGSTGVPKGIMHTHHSGLSFARWAVREYGFRNDDRLGNHAPLHFDLSILDFFAGALAGAATVLIPEEYTRLPASYSKLIADQRITVLFTVPFALIQLRTKGVLHDRDLGALRWILFGGEPFPTKYLRKLMADLPHVRFDNIYGPAEVNGVTHYVVTSVGEDDQSVPIGPIADIAEDLVVDDNDEPVPVGEIGELLVRTPTMMQGYWERPELNAKAFYRRPVSSTYDHVFYRTGDLVRKGADGIFEFLGRKDRQVKVRGYRVELDETEAALVADETVEEAAVFAVPLADGTQEIRAAVILNGAAGATKNELLNGLRDRVPWYGLPADLVIHDSFPRTSTGKIDRKVLRAQAMENMEETA